MSIIWPLNIKKYKITQIFGVNPEAYKRFNLIAHNGIDVGCPVGTQLIAPIEGVVVEVDFDANGYGWYVKIENTAEGALTAHMSRIDVQVGFVVEMGQPIGLSGNTGNSTGPHVHLGYYRIPRNRQNGYNGYIDPAAYLLPIGGTNMSDTFDAHGIDITNMASLQVAINAWWDVANGKYVLKADHEKTAGELESANKDLRDLQGKYDVGFAFLSELDKLGLKNIEDIKAVVKPYMEISAAGFPDLAAIKKAIEISGSTAATSVEQLKKLLDDYNLINTEVVHLRQEVARLNTEYALYNKNTLPNRVAAFLQRLINFLRSRKNKPSDNKILDGATQVIDAWDEFNNMGKEVIN